jgi:nitroreductase
MKLNWEFFGAPVGLFFSIDKFMGKNQWCHLGMMMQNISLLAIENGLATCMQEAWAVYSETMHEFLNLPEERIFYCGMALGYEDKNAPVNKFVTEREKLAEFVNFID